MSIEWDYLMKHLGEQQTKLLKRNITRYKKYPLSLDSQKFLKDFYKDDFLLYNYFKQIPYQDRIPLTLDKLSIELSPFQSRIQPFIK